MEKADIKYKTWDDSINNYSPLEGESKSQSDFGGGNITDFLTGLDLIVWSPGIDVNEHIIAKQAREHNIEIICDIELLQRACPKATYLGITGTNGKSTTVSLMYHILQENGVKSQLGGNIGNPAMSLEMLEEGGIYVIELSSYQLELIKNMEFDAGGVLNLANDHLARHKTMENYMNIKASLLDKSRIKVISIDDDYCKKQADNMKDKITVSVTGKDANIQVKNGWLNDFELSIMQVDKLQYLKGVHNEQNISFAYALLRYATKLSVDHIMVGILRFKGLKHRQQLVRVVNGVSFINDSKATNCDSTATALEVYDNMLWIVGGQSKGGEFNSLSKYLNKIKKAYIIGECESELIEFFNENNYSHYEICKTLDVAMTKAKEDAKEGDVVLLSPACASWDQFDSFEHRGDSFIELV